MSEPRGPTTEELRARALTHADVMREAGDNAAISEPSQPAAEHTASEASLPVLARRALDQIRDALATLSYAADGFYQDEALVSLDALDWLEAHVLPLDNEKGEHLGSPVS